MCCVPHALRIPLKRLELRDAESTKPLGQAIPENCEDTAVFVSSPRVRLFNSPACYGALWHMSSGCLVARSVGQRCMLALKAEAAARPPRQSTEGQGQSHSQLTWGSGTGCSRPSLPLVALQRSSLHSIHRLPN